MSSIDKIRQLLKDRRNRRTLRLLEKGSDTANVLRKEAARLRSNAAELRDSVKGVDHNGDQKS